MTTIIPKRVTHSLLSRPAIRSTHSIQPAMAELEAPSRSYRVALVQLGGIGEDKHANLDRAQSLIDRAVSEGKEWESDAEGETKGKKRNVDLVVLPEIFNSPYAVNAFPRFAEPIPSFSAPISPSSSDFPSQNTSPSLHLLSQSAFKHNIWLIGGSIPESQGEGESKKIYNTSTVWNRKGEMVEKHRKLHLFDIDIPGGITFKESVTLTGGEKVTSFLTEFGRIGLGICYDVRFPEMATIAARQGASAMFYPGAFNMTTGPLHWELLQRARAIDNQIYVGMCSPARNPQSSYTAWGHSTIVNPNGQVISTTDEKESIVFADIDPEFINKTRKGIPITVQRRHDVYPDIAKEFKEY